MVTTCLHGGCHGYQAMVTMATRPWLQYWLPWLPGHGYNTGYHGYHGEW